ncbi:hypothetical protein ABD76_13180 [Paenibacillus dendritiformis]|nr:hypothetical protein [Paenibacillus dendritiformis]
MNNHLSVCRYGIHCMYILFCRDYSRFCQRLMRLYGGNHWAKQQREESGKMRENAGNRRLTVQCLIGIAARGPIMASGAAERTECPWQKALDVHYM